VNALESIQTGEVHESAAPALGYRWRSGQRDLARSLSGGEVTFAPTKAVLKPRGDAEARNVDAASSSVDELAVAHL